MALAYARALKPTPNVLISEWADRFRVLTTSQASEPGRWRTSRVPYLQAIMDAMSPRNPVTRIVVKKSRRCGFTEGVINNSVGAYMHMAPCPILLVQPTEGDAEEWSKDSLDPMLESSPALRRLITPDAHRRKGNTILHKRYRGGVFYARSASTAKSFRRILARLVLMDEVDAYVLNLDGEGDPAKLAEGRADTFGVLRKILMGSTPTVAGQSRIDAEYEASTQGKYLVPCPECGHLQQLVFSQLVWQDDDPTTAEYACIECQALIGHRHKKRMVRWGRWEHAFPERTTLGFHVSALYSPWVTWADLVEQYLAAQGDPLAEQVFVNTLLGETWDPTDQDKWDFEHLRALQVPLPKVPAGAAVLTAGVDVQHDRLVLQVDAYGAGEERWTVERRDILGDTSGPAVWDDLWDALRSPYELESGGWAHIRATCVDTGDTYTGMAWQFCKQHHNAQVWGIKGSSVQGARIWSRERRFRSKGGYTPIIVGVSSAKEVILQRLRRSAEDKAQGIRSEGRAFWHLSDDLPESHLEELTSEVQVVETTKSKTGGPGAMRKRWVLRKSGLRNEGLDVSVYSYAALHGLLAVKAIKLDRPLRGHHRPPAPPKRDENKKLVRTTKSVAPPARRQRVKRKRAKGFMDPD
ncbi:MAG: phage terminase large subunit family protein [Myxococcales bacterium]|nr:phage terminase large subunit family protein [Myxococcales bacterium]